MTDKSRLVVIVIVAMAVILAATAYGYKRHRDSITAQNASGGPHTVTNTTNAQNEEAKVYTFENVLDCAEFLGRDMNSLGVDEKYFSESVYEKLDFTGNFFGVKADGTMFFSDEGENGEKVPTTAYISLRSLDYDTAVENLKTIYGEPTNSGEEPFARANGGAVLWTDFESEKYNIKLSSASERDYIELDVKLK